MKKMKYIKIHNNDSVAVAIENLNTGDTVIIDGQEITIELALCNWNSKTYYAGCVISVITEDGKIINTLNFEE